METTKIWIRKTSAQTISESNESEIDALPAVKYVDNGDVFITVSSHMTVRWQDSECGIGIEQYIYVPALENYVRYSNTAFNNSDRMMIDSYTKVNQQGLPDENGTDNEFNFWKTNLGVIIADAIQDGIIRRQNWL